MATAASPLSIPARGLTFDGFGAGPQKGPLVVLLHGFPQSARAFAQVLPALAAAELRAVAVTQRGYGPGNRTGRILDHTPENLARDVLAIADHLGAKTFHVVGHDLGGLVAWQLAATYGRRVRSATILSTPHPAAYAASLLRSTQALQSAYVPFLQLPVVPQALLGAGGGRVLRVLLRRTGLGAADAAAYAADVTRDGGLRHALHWYRALLLGLPLVLPSAVVPTSYLWSDGDVALGRAAAERTGDHVDADYRFTPLSGVSHWLPEQVPDIVAAAIVERVRAVDGVL